MRTRFLHLCILALVPALLAVACGDDSTVADGSDRAPQATAAGPDDDTDVDRDAVGATIVHKYGETVVPADPRRVVTVGFNDQDDVLALGVVPIGIRDWYGDQPFAVWPWAQAALGDAEPVVLPADELAVEQIAALDPDLIIGVSSGMSEEEYELASSIAPTVPQSGDYPDYGMPWQERTRMIGAALGRDAEAEALVEGIERRLASIRDDHPEFEGATAAVAFVFDDQPGAYSSNDLRAQLMEDLGFVTPAEYDEIAGDSFYASFSAERIDLLDVDVVVWLSSEEEARRAIVESPLRLGLGSYREGREVFLSQELGGAFSFASPLSLDFLLDALVPELALAVDGDPSTAVPSAVEAGAAPDGGSADDGPVAGSGGLDPAAVWELVFDSSVAFADKAGHVENADALEASHAAYVAAGDGLGGITVEAEDAAVDGDTATVAYALLFGGAPAYSDLEGAVELVDGVWTVTEATFCGFLASARTPCS